MPDENIPTNPRRRSARTKGQVARVCSHCGRAFKRTEHLERHARTRELHTLLIKCCLSLTSLTASDTKERPFACACGVTFTRRDLLRRHHRLAGHEELRAAQTGSLDIDPGGLPEQISVRNVAADTRTVHDTSSLAPAPDSHPRAQPPVQHATPGTSNLDSHDGILPHGHNHLDLSTQLLDDSASNPSRTSDLSLPSSYRFRF